MAYYLPTISIEEITTLYLFGVLNKPSNITNDGLIRGPNPLLIQTDAYAYMQNGAGRFANGAQSDLVKAFMYGDLKSANGQRLTFTLDQLVVDSGLSRTFTLQQYEYSDSINDSKSRIYIYGSTPFSIAQGAVFVIEADGTRHIENYAILPNDDNFDFTSNNPLIQFGDSFFLEPKIDPSKIGRKVLIEYTAASKNAIVRDSFYSQADLANDVAKYESTYHPISGLTNLYDAATQSVDQLWSSGIIKFLDPNNKPILYGTLGADNLLASNVYDMPMLSPYAVNGVVLISGAGNDTLTGGQKNDKLYGGDDNDWLIGGNVGDSGNDSLYGGNGNDKLGGSDGNDALYGEGGNDRLNGDDGLDFVYGGVGHDNIDGGDGNDFLYGEGGNDSIAGGAGDDILDGATGKDTLRGGSGADQIGGGDDADNLYGDAGVDIIEGGQGDDTINGGSSGDILNGGPGYDTYIVDNGDVINDGNFSSPPGGAEGGVGGSYDDTVNAGEVWFGGERLNIATRVFGQNYYVDKFGNIFQYIGVNSEEGHAGSDLSVSNAAGTSFIRINNHVSGSLNIYLLESPGGGISPGTSLPRPNPSSPLIYIPPEPVPDPLPPPPPGDGVLTAPITIIVIPPESGKGGRGNGKKPKNGDGPGGKGKKGMGNASGARSPLVVDLDGDGVETIDVEQGVNFDHDGNGFAEATGWVKSDDGILVLDRNNNGQIDDGKELFGNGTFLASGEHAANGFTALAEFDSNSDGKVDANDAIFSQLRVWRDLNSDGISQVDELLTLSSVGVQSINLAYFEQGFIDANLDYDPNGTNAIDTNNNQHRQVGTYINVNGITTAVHDVWFDVDTASTIDKNIIPISEEIAGLPDVEGFGNVHDLQQAMQRDTTGQLKDLVIQFGQEDDPALRQTLIVQILYHWAGVQDVDPESRAATQIYGNVIGDARKLETLEEFVGYEYLGTWCWGSRDPNPHGVAAPILLQTFDELAGYVYGELMLQTHFAPLVSLLNLQFYEDDTVSWDVANVVAIFEEKYSTDSEAARQYISEFANSLKTFDSYRTDFLLETLRAAGDINGSEFSQFLASLGINTGIGDFGNNTLNGTDDHDDALYGYQGDDRLYGMAGGDTLDGGSGNDYLAGGDGADTYLFGHGSGKDTILNADADGLGTNLDVLKLGAGIVATDVALYRDYYDLVLKLKGTQDEVRIQSYFDEDTLANQGYVIDKIQFADGSYWDVAAVKALVLQPTEADDYIVGYNSNDILSGAGGNDNISGRAGNDSLEGGVGNDTLSGEAGNDTLDGGAGNDQLSGGDGADTYKFGIGSGQDTINNYDSNAQGTNADTILLGSGIVTTGVTVTRNADNLYIHINTTDDSLEVVNYFSEDVQSPYAIENIKFSDNTVWSIATVKSKILAGTINNDTINGFQSNDVITGLDGNDVIYASGGDDSINGGTGSDNLYGESGNDTLDGGAGNDVQSGGDGADVYKFGIGSGQDTINNYDSDAQGTNADTVLLGAGITTTGVTLTRTGDSLFININGKTDRLEIANYFIEDGVASYAVENIKFADNTVWNLATVKTKVLTGTLNNDNLIGFESNDTINGSDGRDVISGRGGNDSIDGGAGNDFINGDNGNDIVNGGAGDDTLFGDTGNDTLDGGAGNDVLSGGDGADTYKFGIGSGQDTINNYDSDSQGTNADTILLGAGITTTGVTLTRSGDSLYIAINGKSDRLEVANYFTQDGAAPYAVENIKFADNTVWNLATVKTKVLTGTVNNDDITGFESNDTINGLEGQDTISGRGGNDTINGGAGNDNIYAEAGNDSIVGGAGNDNLYGDLGNDILDGGTENDALNGGDGADTYKFGIGYGQDTIHNYDSDAQGTNADTILLGAGIATTGVTLTRNGDSLFISINGTNDRLEVTNYFYLDGTSTYAVENIKFADNTVWNLSTVKSKVLASTVNNDNITGFASNDSIAASDGNDFVSGQAGNDTIDGGTGNDSLYGDTGNDSLVGGVGSDSLNGGEGSDVLDGGAGNDILSGDDGADTYKFGIGSGQDVINNYDYDNQGTNADTILLGAGIATSGVTLTRSGYNLHININGTNDTLQVTNYFTQDGVTSYAVENIKFADNTIWNLTTVKTKVLTSTINNDDITGFESNDTINGSDGRDNIYGVGGNDSLEGGSGADYVAGGDGNDILNGVTGNDTLYGDLGNDTLDGGSGNDYLYGGEGTDSINGGSGNDTLVGGSGSDTLDGGSGNDYLYGGDGAGVYKFGTGSGRDSINNYDYDAYGTDADTILLGTGITTSGIKLTRENDHLYLSINGTDDVLEVTNYFIQDGASAYGLENIKFADNTIWNYATVLTKLSTATPPTGTTINGTTAAQTHTGTAGNDMIYADAGNDTLDGAAGNDYLNGGDGADTYKFGIGSGQDSISNYDTDAQGTNADTILLGAGITTTGVTLTRSGDNLYIAINGKSDKLEVTNYFSEDGITPYAVENIKFADNTIWNLATVRTKVTTGTTADDSMTAFASNDTLTGLGGDDSIYGQAGNDTIDGGADEDRLFGGDGADSLTGGTGSDILYGDAGNDVLDGGAGNDYLYGGDGADIYKFGIGSGQDAINNYDSDTQGTNIDTILLGTGVTTTGITLTRSGDSLFIAINGKSDRLEVTNYFSEDGVSPYAIENIKFADNTIWDVATVKSKLITGTTADDAMTGYATNDTINGLAGIDTIYGQSGDDVIDGGTDEDRLFGGDGNDSLAGGTANDYLYGDAGNDTVDGGAGNDTLYGGDGADVYKFGIGSGQDYVSNYDSDAQGTNADTILLGAGITTTGVTLTRNGDSLFIAINGKSDRLEVSNYFSEDGTSTYAVENIKFADNTIWDVATVKNKVITGTASDDNIQAFATNDTLNGLAGSDSIYGQAGNDTIDGGADGDWLYGGEGSDSVTGGTGADILYGDAGNDTLDGGSGNDTLNGSDGADIYKFGTGSGQDVINNYDSDTLGTNTDTILLGTGITTTGVTLTRSGDSLYISINGTNDRLEVASYFLEDGVSPHAVENIKFADNTVWSVTTVKAKVIAGSANNDYINAFASNDNLTGLAGNDNINGQAGNDTMDGGADEDTLTGGDGNDVINGGTGIDTLYGDAGNDTLDGGAGNDYLNAGDGADTYKFGTGSGQDTINNVDSDEPGTNADTILLGAGITTTGVTLTRSSDSLFISINGTNDSLEVSNFFSQDATSPYAVENLKFADNTIWDVTTIKAKVTLATSGDDILTGYASNDSLSGGTGNDTIYGKEGNDILTGGVGEDRLYGDDGDDLLLGGTQGDWLYDGAGNDILQGQEANDWLSGDVGNNVLDGGAGNDIVTSYSGHNLAIGGKGNDTINSYSGYDVIAFNKGDGQDTLSVSPGPGNTISLGNGANYAEMSFSKSGDDLILKTSAVDQVVLTGWYYNPNSIANLQVIAEAMEGFNATGTNTLLDNKVETFDFAGLVGRFDQALAADPTVSNWALSNALLDFHLGGSDTAAIGGDLAYQYGKTGSLTGIGLNAAQGVINDTQFGQSAQTLNNPTVWQAEVVKLA